MRFSALCSTAASAFLRPVAPAISCNGAGAAEVVRAARVTALCRPRPFLVNSTRSATKKRASLLYDNDDGYASEDGRANGPSKFATFSNSGGSGSPDVNQESSEAGSAFARERIVVRNVYEETSSCRKRSDDEIREFFDKHAIRIEGPAPKPVLALGDLKLPKKLKQEFLNNNITSPTPIQSVAWPIAMSGSDMIGIAQTGSGKTLGYLVPSACHILAQPSSQLQGPTALVVAPTRELTQQILEVANKWLFPSVGLRSFAVYGGADRNLQVQAVRRKIKLCIATPGRLLDLLDSREISLANSSMLVLDEADRMLDMGFEPQIRQIVAQMRRDRQTLMFSATWPPDVRQLAADFMNADVTRINIGSTELCANSDIRQEIRLVSPSDKKKLLLQLIQSRPNDKILVFAATKRNVSALAREILHSGIRCVESHGDLSQAKREKSLALFQDRANVMVATDVAARGLDVRNITLVINVDFPQTIENYVHRIGRTGRCGNKGEAITFFTEDDSAFAAPLIKVLRQANQEVPSFIQSFAEDSRNKRQPVSFRSAYQKPKLFRRTSKASSWKRSAYAGN